MKKRVVILIVSVLIVGLLGFIVIAQGGNPAGNGDINADGEIDIGDVVSLASWLFLGGDAPAELVNFDYNSIFECYDTDVENNPDIETGTVAEYFEPGATIIRNKYTFEPVSQDGDFCIFGTNYLVENRCVADSYFSYTSHVKCEFGCDNGACNKEGEGVAAIPEVDYNDLLECYDTDVENNNIGTGTFEEYYIPGGVIIRDRNDPQTIINQLPDFCVIGTNYLVEQRCTSDSFSSYISYILCPNGCQDNKCLR